MRFIFYFLLTFFLFSCGPSLPLSTTVRVAVHSGNSLTIKKIPLEHYLMGVLQSELPNGWPLEAIKAQAVASRSYALYRKAHPRSPDYDLEATTHDQVFTTKIKNRKLLLQALRETSGEVLAENNQVIPAFFHSCCGGTSERGSEVWPEVTQSSFDQTKGDPYCEACPRYHWDLHLAKEELNKLIRTELDTQELIVSVAVQGRDESGRVTSLVFTTARGKHEHLSGTKFRELIGYTRLFSTLFDITDHDTELWFTGKGAGHGVGLCQWGAKGMADQGKNYREILEFYYPGATLTQNTNVTQSAAPETIPNLSAPETSPVDPE